MYIPKPRAGLEIERGADRWHLRDPITAQTATLNAFQIAIFEALGEGHTTPEALLKALPEADPGRVFRAVKALEEGLMLDGPLWRIQQELFEAREATKGSAAGLRLHASLAHQCVGCGSSCSGVTVGPVPERTIQAIDAFSLWQQVSGRRSGDDCVETVEASDRQLKLMARQEGGCVMLDGEGRCRVHAAAGPEAKPGICNQFPYTLTATPDGVYVGLQMECRSFIASATAGAAVDAETRRAQVEQLDALPDVQHLRIPTPVPLAPGVFATWADYRRWWSDAIAHLEEGAELDTLGDTLEALVKTKVPVGAFAWRDSDAWPEAVRGVAGRALQRKGLLKVLIGTCDEALMAAGEDEDLQAEMLEMARKGMLWLLGLVPTGRVRPGDEDGPRLLRTAMLAEVYGHQHLLRRDVAWGLGRLALTVELSWAIAVVRAWQVGRVVVYGQDVNDGVVVAQKVMRSPHMLTALMRMGPAVRSCVGFGVEG